MTLAHPFHVLSTVDSALGRLDYHSLPHQALMEMLIDGMEEGQVDEYKDENGNLIDVCEWRGIECADDRVEFLHISYKWFTEKRFPFEFIPPRVDLCEAEGCNLHGTLDTAVLPSGLEVFDVSVNELYGTLNLKSFPREMQKIRVYDNALTGSLALADLPQSLKEFDAGLNKFSGEIYLNDLPPPLERLSIDQNALTGSISIETLPMSIQKIDLSENSFLGDIHVHTFPQSLQRIDLSGNALSGKAILSKTSGAMHFRMVMGRTVSSVVDENGDKHVWHDDIMKTKW